MPIGDEGSGRGLLEGIDGQARNPTSIPTISPAIRRLVELGLKAKPGK